MLAGDERRTAFPLRSDGRQIGTLTLPASVAAEDRERVAERIVPALESLLGAALDRATLEEEVVETAALRHSDELKTALLRSVSHDLRTPLTAILSATASLDPEHPEGEQVAEVREVVTLAAERLASLIEKLLDLSRLQAGSLDGRPAAYSLDEVISEAIEHVEGDRSLLRVSVDDDLPLLVGDAGQLERAFANLIENALRYGAGKPVLVRARVVSGSVRVRITDQGPGIRPARSRADLPALLPLARAAERPPGVRPRARDREGLHRGGRRAGHGRLSARPGHELRRRAPLARRAASEPAVA